MGKLHLQASGQSASADGVARAQLPSLTSELAGGELFLGGSVLDNPAGAVDDYFGDHLSMDGDTLVIGAWGSDGVGEDSGAVYVAQRQGDTWEIAQPLIASLPSAQARFGYTTDISGDVIAVGAWGDRLGGTGERGAVDIYVRATQTGAWSPLQKIVAPDGRDDDAFGFSLSLSQDWLAVGAPTRDGARSDIGAVYMYKRRSDGSAWDFVQRIDRELAGDANDADLFGAAVALDGGELAIGAPGNDTRALDGGAVYIYELDASGSTWNAHRKLVATETQGRDSFGQSVDIQAGRCLVGAPGADSRTSTQSETGAVYVFERSGPTRNWTQTQQLTPNQERANEFFGLSVALGASGTRAVVGALEEQAAVLQAGRALVFEADSDGAAWTQTQVLAPASNGEGFGYVVSTSQDQIAVGAFGDQASTSSSGRVYTFARGTLKPTPLLGGLASLGLLFGLGALGARKDG